MPEPHAPATESDPLLLEQDPLRHHGADPSAPADPPLRVDHAVPRNVRRAPSHRAADRARGTRTVEQRRDLSVRRDPPSWNPPRHPIHRVGEGPRPLIHDRPRIRPRPRARGTTAVVGRLHVSGVRRPCRGHVAPWIATAWPGRSERRGTRGNSVGASHVSRSRHRARGASHTVRHAGAGPRGSPPRECDPDGARGSDPRSGSSTAGGQS